MIPQQVFCITDAVVTDNTAEILSPSLIEYHGKVSTVKEDHAYHVGQLEVTFLKRSVVEYFVLLMKENAGKDI